MMWGKSQGPDRTKALRDALYAYSKYMEGVEKSYMVQAAIDDLVIVYGLAADRVECITFARQALAEDDEGQKHSLMARALKDVIARQCY